MHNPSEVGITATTTTSTTTALAKTYNDRLASPAATVLPYQLTCSIITPTCNKDNIAHGSTLTSHSNRTVGLAASSIAITTASNTTLAATTTTNPAETTHMTLLNMRRRRLFQRRACLLSIVGAFVLGLALGVFVPMFGLANYMPHDLSLTDSSHSSSGSLSSQHAELHMLPLQPSALHYNQHNSNNNNNHSKHANYSHPAASVEFPTIYAQAQLQPEYATPAPLTPSPTPIAVSFVKEQALELSAEEVFRNAFHLEQDKQAPDTMIVKKLDASDGSIKEFHVQRIANGRFRKGPERRLSKPSLAEQMLHGDGSARQGDTIKFVPIAQRIAEQARSAKTQGYIKSDIYWGDLVEQSLPHGFNKHDALNWNRYVATKGVVTRLETGCGRMQNRLVIFADGKRACARYRQNTDQIQGELFSFYLGQLLNLTNLAPSAAAVINLDATTWSSALNDITQAQWKQQRPVVLTQWLPDLEPAGIPQPFQPLERHLNKYDVWNITLGTTESSEVRSSSSDENTNSDRYSNEQQQTQPTTGAPIMQQLIELAQWSDLIVFDYLIANLDRVVNNLYNFQWNADIMAAPAHNLARQINTQLLVFLDNESGLLHGYRLLKKYEAYHGLLLDNLCVFRQPTIEALRQLRSYGVGQRLREAFEQTTSQEVRDVLPSLPDKSIKILIERIDRVLGQVQKCRDLLADR